MFFKFKDEDYVIDYGDPYTWVGIGNRYWFTIKRTWRKKFKIELITNQPLNKFKTEEEAVDYAKCLIRNLAEMLQPPKEGG